MHKQCFDTERLNCRKCMTPNNITYQWSRVNFKILDVIPGILSGPLSHNRNRESERRNDAQQRKDVLVIKHGPDAEFMQLTLNNR